MEEDNLDPFSPFASLEKESTSHLILHFAFNLFRIFLVLLILYYICKFVVFFAFYT
jgi:hypothetical protein